MPRTGLLHYHPAGPDTTHSKPLQKRDWFSYQFIDRIAYVPVGISCVVHHSLVLFAENETRNGAVSLGMYMVSLNLNKDHEAKPT